MVNMTVIMGNPSKPVCDYGVSASTIHCKLILEASRVWEVQY